LADGAHDGGRALACTVTETGATTAAHRTTLGIGRVGGEGKTMTSFSDLIAGLADAVAGGVATDTVDTMTRDAVVTALAEG